MTLARSTLAVLASLGVVLAPAASRAGQDPQPDGGLVDYSIDDDPADAAGDGDGDGDEATTPPEGPVLDQRGVPTKANDFSFMAMEPKRGIGLTVAGGTLFGLGLAGQAGGAALIVRRCSVADDESLTDFASSSLGCLLASAGGFALFVVSGTFEFAGMAMIIPGSARMGKFAAFENHFIRRHPPKKMGIVTAVGGGVLGAGVLSWIAGPIIKRSRCPTWADAATINPDGTRVATGREVVSCRTTTDTVAFNLGMVGITVGASMLAYGVKYKKASKRHQITYPLQNVAVLPTFDHTGGGVALMGQF